MISSARSVSMARIPASASALLRWISSVVSDLTFTTLFAPVPCTISVMMRLASAASRAQWTCPPARWTAASSCNRYSSRWYITCALIADPAARRASQSGSSLTTESRLARMLAVALPRLRRSWLLPKAVLAAWGNGGRDLDGITEPRFLCWPGFRPNESWSHRHADDAGHRQSAAGRTCRLHTAPQHQYPARNAFCHST